ncbi:uncharacterized protein [Rutidosis leptorrhynchoides]|uniref:uncharacterized protein n=1 Tax=Rutidosis leptorrhynchoides TaxID=125765 RepID=UPI003A991463
MSNWKASSRIMGLKNMARTGVIGSNASLRKCKSCGPKCSSKNHSSKQCPGKDGASAGHSINNVEIKILSLNVCGFGVIGKFRWVKGLCVKERPDFAAFQETKCGFLEDGFKATSAIGNDYFLAVHDNWLGSGHETIFVNVYGPHNDKGKKEFWRLLGDLIKKVGLAWVVCGDFNEVRVQSDRLNCVFNHARASRFNNFIAEHNLIEIPINGKKFTRICDNGINFSKLDCFLINDAFINLWQDLSIVALDRREPDHCPLILRDKVINFGTKPFKVFDEWFTKDGILNIINEGWAKDVCSVRKDCIFRDKLKNVKNGLKGWSKGEFENLDKEINELRIKVANLEQKAKSNIITDGERKTWIEARVCWLGKEKIKSSILKQEARSRWILEGDENSRFFHASIKQKYNKCNICGLNINGSWTDDPNLVKTTVLTHFKNIFGARNVNRPFLIWPDMGGLRVPVGPFCFGPDQVTT